MSAFEALTWILEPWFNTSFEELPDSVRERVERDFPPVPWDALSPEQRRLRARQWDYSHDPATEAEREHWFDFYTRYAELKKQIEQWEGTQANAVSEIVEKERRLETLHGELRRMDAEVRYVVDRYVPPRPEAPKSDPNSPAANSFLPYPRALKALEERLGATAPELAVWIFLGPKTGGLTAYRNANEIDQPPQFYFESYIGHDYLSAMMGCWFVESDIQAFTPQERFITGVRLVERWSAWPGLEVEAYIRAKIAESRLQDLHPTFGLTQGSIPADIELPTIVEALFSLTEVALIEEEDFGIKSSHSSTEPQPRKGSSAWLSERGRKAANARHSQSGGTRAKHDELTRVWLSGKYKTKIACADAESTKLGIARSTALRILRNK